MDNSPLVSVIMPAYNAAAHIAEAFNILYWLEMACKAQVDAMAANTELTLPPGDTAERTAHLFSPGVRRTYGEMEWEAMLRQLDREDSSYRD